MLCKPTVITNYPTAKSQINDNVDGVILEKIRWCLDRERSLIFLHRFLQYDDEMRRRLMA